MTKKIVVFIVLLAFFQVVQPKSGWQEKRRPRLYRPGDDTVLVTSCGTFEHELDATPTFYTVADRSVFIFQVKACSHARLLLTSAVTRHALNINIARTIRLIILGDNDNSAVTVRHQEIDPQTTNYVTNHEVAAPDLLHCAEFRTFWLSFATPKPGSDLAPNTVVISLGRGPLVGEQQLYSGHHATVLESVVPQGVNAVALQCDKGHTAVWRVPENSGDHVTFITLDKDGYNDVWKDVHHDPDVEFYVKACNGVRILLSEEYGRKSPRFFEILINVHPRQILINSDLGSVIGSTPFDLSCTEFKQMWITWHWNLIAVGHGPKVLYNVLAQFYGVHGKGKFGNIKWLSFSSTDAKQGAVWVLEDSAEVRHEVMSVPQQLDSNCRPIRPEEESKLSAVQGDAEYCTFWLEVPTEECVYLSAATEGTAAIALTARQRPTKGEDYEVLLANGASRIMKGGDHLAIAQNEIVLDRDAMHDFWLCWHGAEIQIGRGHVFGQNLLLSSPITSQKRISHLGLGHIGSPVEWEVKDRFGQEVTYYTYGSALSPPLWKITPNRNYAVLRVQACSNAHILLSNSPADLKATEQPHIDINITPKSQDITFFIVYGIKKIPLKLKTVHFKEDVLSCEKLRQLWVSWVEDYIRIGVGPFPGRHIIAQVPNELPVTVNALSIITREGQPGRWVMGADRGDSTIYNSIGSETIGKSNWLILNEDKTWITFEICACSDANIFLAYDTRKMTEGVLVSMKPDGGKTSYIKEVGKMAVSDVSDSLELSCDESRQFWLAWNALGDTDTLVQVGEGSTPRTDHMKLQTTIPTRHPFRALAFWSGINHRGAWVWPETSASWGHFITAGDSSHQQLKLTVDHRQDLVFNVLACEDVQLTLSDEIGTSSTISHTYIIKIGGHGNTMSSIEPGYSNPDLLLSKGSPAILSCNEYRMLWISWYTGQIRFGKGNDVGNNSILAFQELRREEIKMITLSSFSGKTVHWDLPLLQEPKYVIAVTKPDEDHILARNGGIVIGVLVGLVLLSLLALTLALLHRDGRLEASKCC